MKKLIQFAYSHRFAAMHGVFMGIALYLASLADKL